MECSSNITENECNCTLYWMPRVNGSKICNRKKAVCYEKVLYNIAYSTEEKYLCSKCLPACFEINYGREISSAKLGTGDFLTAEEIPEGNVTYIRDNVAILHIFFNDNSYGGFTKSELIGFTEFLSNTGARKRGRNVGVQFFITIMEKFTFCNKFQPMFLQHVLHFILIVNLFLICIKFPICI
jgi:hypothetical protein